MFRKLRIGIALIAIAGFVSCEGDYIPKPNGYYRIALEEKNYVTYDSDCPFSFDFPDISKIENGGGPCWININYPKYNATIHMTYKALYEENAMTVLKEASMLAYDHTSKAEGISGTEYSNPNTNVHGMVFDIYGNSASNVQFFVTDSTRNFLRGALYFNAIPNSDSIAPIKDYIRDDIFRVVESLRWR